MDETYDMLASAIALDLELKDAQSVSTDKQLVTMFKESNHNIKVAEYTQPKCWRLMKLVENSEDEEVIVRLQGIIGLKELPPYARPTMSTTSDRRRFLRQGITLTGANSMVFDEVINTIHSVCSGFRRHLPEDTLLPWTASVFQQQKSIDIGNRYFTPRHSAHPQGIIPLATNIDPRGVLQKLQGSDLVHTTDNSVEYYERIKNAEGKKRHVKINPQQFRVGDIVEVQISFVVIPIKDQKHKMLLVLRALTLLNSKFTEDAISKRAERSTCQTRVQTSLKRKVGYEDDDDEVANIRKAVSTLRMAVEHESGFGENDN